jgi:hypothetical protein
VAQKADAQKANTRMPARSNPPRLMVKTAAAFNEVDTVSARNLFGNGPSVPFRQARGLA